MSHGEDSGGAKTLTDDSKEEEYIYERDRSASESAEKKKSVIIEAEERYVCLTPLVNMILPALGINAASVTTI